MGIEYLELTWLSAAYSGTVEKGLSTIQCSLLVIHDKEDEFGSTLHPLQFSKLARSDMEMLLLNDHQHMPCKEGPESVIDTVDRLL